MNIVPVRHKLYIFESPLFHRKAHTACKNVPIAVRQRKDHKVIRIIFLIEQVYE